MKKKNQKPTQEQIDSARQKRISSSEFRGRLKNSIEALRLFNNTKKQKLSKKEIKEIATYFCERFDSYSTRSKEPNSLEATLDEVITKK